MTGKTSFTGWLIRFRTADSSWDSLIPLASFTFGRSWKGEVGPWGDPALTLGSQRFVCCCTVDPKVLCTWLEEIFHLGQNPDQIFLEYSWRVDEGRCRK